jgi:hypothetical protein
MARELRIETEESVPGDATVRHYDELAEEAKAELPSLVTGDPTASVPEHVAEEFEDGEYIKFTDYLRVR